MIFNKGKGGLRIALVLSLFFIFLVLPLASAAKPVTIEFVGDSSLIIHANPFDYYAINTAAELHFHVLNKSNGALMTPTTTDCEVELVNSVGTVILEGNPVAHDDHFKMMRNSSIVTTEGVYALSILCNSTGLYGIKTAYFEATGSGEEDPGFSTAQLFFIFFFLGYIILFIGAYWKNNLLVILGSMLVTGEGLWLFTNNLGTFASTSPQMVIFATINLAIGLYFLIKGSFDFMNEGLW